MSAYLVSESHILTLAFHYDRLVNENTSEKIDITKINEIAIILWKENNKSVNYRYNEKNRLPKFSIEFDIKTNLEMADLLKQIHCWEYQTCEHPDHAKSKAWKMMQELKIAMLDYVIRNQHPHATKYEEASWGIY